ncbi:hypothetical protein AKO1_012674 [Acrasis kona]|uniref:VLRF1 domain-containing protein n=1 Tax=Acrasis kona TaxID=1008807 RepID=A0AAW2YWE3_9EUKA
MKVGNGKYILFSQNFPRQVLSDPITSVRNNAPKNPGLVSASITHTDENGCEESLHVSMWKPLVSTLKYEPKNQQTLLTESPELSNLLKPDKVHTIAVLICHGGSFSGCIFKCEEPVKSNRTKSKLEKHQVGVPVIKKSFHKYTTRKKQGGRQISHDNAGGPAQSIGSQIRRDQEKLFQVQLANLLQNEWHSALEGCTMICLYTPGHLNYTSVVNLLPATWKDKIHKIPFTLRKVNYSHVILAFKKLMTVHVRDYLGGFEQDDSDVSSGEEDTSGMDSNEDDLYDYMNDNNTFSTKTIQENFEEYVPNKRKKKHAHVANNTNRDWMNEALTPLSSQSTPSTGTQKPVNDDIFDVEPIKEKVIDKPIVVGKKHSEKKTPLKKPSMWSTYKWVIGISVLLGALLYTIFTEDYTKERESVYEE